ncbi:hypothetical protein [Clostridium sp. Marseille-Q7071]
MKLKNKIRLIEEKIDNNKKYIEKKIDETGKIKIALDKKNNPYKKRVRVIRSMSKQDIEECQIITDELNY